MSKQRIQKVIAASGWYSRRQIERLIDEGQVKVNGIVLHVKGFAIDPLKDRVQIEGKAFHFEPQQKNVYLLFHKPRRTMVTRSDPEGRQTVYDLLPKKFHHLKPVGRLDFNSQGALLLTSDGDMILKLTHPRYHLDKIYEVKVTSKPDEKQLRRLEQGIVIEGVRTLPARVIVKSRQKSSTILEFRLHEGKNRQIRNMCEAVGLTVKELRRVAIGPIQIKNLRSGMFRYLSPKELNQLRKLS